MTVGRVAPDGEEFAESAATEEVPLDAPEDDVGEQRQTVREPVEHEGGHAGVDADERVVDLDEDEYR